MYRNINNKIFLLFSLTILLFSCSKEKRSDKAAEKMQEFVINISNYARGIDPDFIIIPQNGAELSFNNIDVSEGLNSNYISAIDGVGIEALFYDEQLLPEDERLNMVKQIKTSKKVLVSDYITDNTNVADAISRNKSEGFICFPRVSNNYDYLYIPDSVIDENINEITSLQDAKNYLYLINTDSYSTKQDMINAISATNFDVVLIDMDFNEESFTSTEISQLKTKLNGAKRLVISYINVGAAENWRYYWKKKWNTVHPCWMKKKYEGYKDERWVKFWKKDWQEIIYGNDNSYIKKIINAGFDGAYLDNVEAFYFLYYKD